MQRASHAECALFDAVARTAEKLRGSRQPSWYLLARLDQMLDDHGIMGSDRADIAARAFFILDRFAQMAPDVAQADHRHGRTTG